MTPYQQWAAANPGEAGKERGGLQWFEDTGEFPRMMYRAGEPMINDDNQVVNRFHGVVCETHVAQTEDEAMTLVGDGWHFSPKDAAVPVADAPRGPGRPKLSA